MKNSQVFNYNNPREKVYLHFDNTGYFAGETVWFKAYIVTAEENKPTEMSRILYVELLTTEGKIIDERKLKIQNGQCNGEFTIDRMSVSGYYEVRAYTRYMLNFGEENLFSRIFPILNPDTDPKETEEEKEYEPDETSPFLDKMRKKIKTSKKEQLNLHFYPEGGNTIKGIQTRIAFKATDENGRAVEVEGTVFDAENREIASLKTQHRGMGVFNLIPGEKENYIIIKKGNKKQRFNIPASLSTGYNMNLIRTNEKKRKIILQKTEDIRLETIGLLLTCRGKTVIFEKIENRKLPLNFEIDEEKLTEGVNRMTLFDSKGEILSERLFFVSKKQTKNLTITPNKKKYRNFEKINLKLQLSGEQTEAASISLSVRDAGQDPEFYALENIRSNLLLSSELKGYIENPGYYFEKDDDEHANALDLLMMVQGWKKYEWKEAVENRQREKEHYIEKEILIKGQVLSLIDKLPVDSVEVSLQIAGPDSFLLF